MKVVEYGYILPFYAFCTGCGAVLEFTKRDAKMSNICLAKGPRNDGRDYMVACPVCGRILYEHSWKTSKEEV